MRLVHEMALANPRHIVADMVDAHGFPRLADRFSVHSVPLTVINGLERITGVVSEARLLGLLRGLSN